MFVFLFLTPLHMIISVFTHVAFFHSFFVAEQYSSVCVYHIFIHSSVDGHLSCSFVLAVVNGETS